MNPPAAYPSLDHGPLTPEKREDGKEHRRHARVRDTFPVTLVSSRGLFGGRRMRGQSRDYDVEGACIKTSKSLPKGTKVKVRLHLPDSLSHFFRGLPCELAAEVRESRPGRSGKTELVLKWEQPLPGAVKATIASYQFKVGSVIALLLAFVVWFKWRTLGFFWYTPFFYVYSVTLLSYLVSRFYLSWKHRNPPMAGLTPSVSIIIPVRNEEKSIVRTVESCFATDYPADKREVVVIDDGSTDATPKVLKELKARFPELAVVTLKPTGKRGAMAEGVRKTHGEIIIFVDSDTFLWPSALRNIVCGFEDPTLGASAGYTEVENADKNMLTGLQEVRYFVSFRLLKSSESLYSAVTCCPGCLSAYRRKYVLEVLDPWLNQMFLGNRATFGDDRSLTNFILRKYRVIYNDRAVCGTLVPENWKQYMTQQVRWKKSWLRETMIAGRFMYKKHPVAALSFYSAAIFSLLSPAMVFRVIFLEIRAHDAVFVYYLLGLVMVALLQSLYFLYKRPSPHWVLGMMWMASSLILTGPQTYYAMLTMNRNHWGTR